MWEKSYLNIQLNIQDIVFPTNIASKEEHKLSMNYLRLTHNISWSGTEKGMILDKNKCHLYTKHSMYTLYMMYILVGSLNKSDYYLNNQYTILLGNIMDKYYYRGHLSNKISMYKHHLNRIRKDNGIFSKYFLMNLHNNH